MGAAMKKWFAAFVSTSKPLGDSDGVLRVLRMQMKRQNKRAATAVEAVPSTGSSRAARSDEDETASRKAGRDVTLVTADAFLAWRASFERERDARRLSDEAA
jgi:hypothetical protein